MGIRHQVTVVVAPAGFGKTVAMSDWYRSSSTKNARSWLSLDHQHAAPGEFWSAFVAAIRKSVPSALESTLRTLADGGPASGLTFTRTLVNDLCRISEECVLVIDDFHFVEDPGVVRDLTEIIDHLPPTFKLVISSRTKPALPVAKWKSKGTLSEIRTEVLQFSDDEAHAYLDLTIAGEISQAHTDRLVAECRGWIACLHLAALRIQESATPAEFVETLAEQPSPIVDYLVAEVVGSLGSAAGGFLEDTAVLDEFSASECEGLTGRSDCDQLLEHLARSGVISKKSSTTGHYTCHPLVRSVLYTRLQSNPARLARLHRDVAVWLHEHGDVALAADHAIMGEDFDAASTWIIDNALTLLQKGPAVVPGFIDRLPVDVASHPRMHPLRTYAALIGGSVDSLTDIAARSENVLSDELVRTVGIAADLLTGSASLALTAASDPAAAQMPSAIRSLALGMALSQTGSLTDAAAELRTVLAARPSDPFLELAATSALAWNRVEAGQLGEGKTLARRALDLAAASGIRWFHPVRYAELALARVAYDRGSLDDAHRLASWVAESPTEDVFVSVENAILLSAIQAALGDRSGAREVLNDGFTGPDGRPVSGDLSFRLVLAHAELYLRDLDLSLAESWLPDWRSRVENGPTTLRERLALAHFLIADHRPVEARSLLAEATAPAEPTARYLIEAAKLDAISAVAVNDPAAPMTMEIAMAMGEPERFVQTYVDDTLVLAGVSRGVDAGITAAVGSVHAAFVGHRSRPAGRPRDIQSDDASLAHELTERELAVLRLLPSRLSNQEIAHELFVSINTVKSHIRSIYSKLGVNSRNAAVAQATALRLS